MASTGTGRRRTPKRSGSPLATTTPTKKKRPVTPSNADEAQSQNGETAQPSTPQETEVTKAGTPAKEVTNNTAPTTTFVFKDPKFVHSAKGPPGAKKTKFTWKNLKQIVAAEKNGPSDTKHVPYGSIDAPPSFKPLKKYSEITGLSAKYTDPQTKLRYTTTAEFTRIRMLPSDIVTGYLSLRGANTPVP